MINNTGFKGQNELKTKVCRIDALASTWGLSRPSLSEVGAGRGGLLLPLAGPCAASLGVEGWMSSPNLSVS